MNMRELTRDEAKALYENGETMAITFDIKNPRVKVNKFNAETMKEPDFDKAVDDFEFIYKILLFVKYGKTYGDMTGQRNTVGFYKITEEQE